MRISYYMQMELSHQVAQILLRTKENQCCQLFSRKSGQTGQKICRYEKIRPLVKIIFFSRFIQMVQNVTNFFQPFQSQNL
jgi:hypothetical protein